MKCIRCGHDSKYKDRLGQQCPACHGHFAFEPQTGDIMTDVAFQSAIIAVSSAGRIRWGIEHLYYEICRRKRQRPHYLRVGILGSGVSAGLFFFAAPPVGLIAGGATAILLAREWGNSRDPTVRVPLDTFNSLWSRWCQVHETTRQVIVRQEPAEKIRPTEPDLGDYSFDRAVICDRARTVDLLLANNFHFENNCAVLSIDGYPPGPFETVRTMLTRNPRLRVLALHDATPEGCGMAYKLANDSSWFKDHVPVVDVGLRPAHSRPLKGLFLSAEGVVAAGEDITPEEAQWLSQYRLELAAIRPEQVLKRLFRALHRDDDISGTTGGDGGGVWTGNDAVLYDTESFSADAGDFDGGGDSFG